jgi:small subunit ribosomal protein S16
MVKLRLKRMGSINKPFYRIVSLDSRKKRDGAYLESIGYYDPKTDPFTLKVDTDRAIHWLSVGAQPSDTVRSLFKKAGILQKWHETKFADSTDETKKTEKRKTKQATETKVKKTKEVEEPAEKKAEEIVEPEVKAEEKVEEIQPVETEEAKPEEKAADTTIETEEKVEEEKPVEEKEAEPK